MKKIQLFFILLFICRISYAQSDVYVHGSIDITHRQDNFNKNMELPRQEPDWDNINRSLSIADVRFKNQVAGIKECLNKLYSIDLVNKYNYVRLEEYKNNINKIIQNINLDDPSFDITTCNIINQYQKDNPIRDEINLLNNLYAEISNMKHQNPGSFTTSPRYKELMSVVDELFSCSNNDIRLIAIKHSLLN